MLPMSVHELPLSLLTSITAPSKNSVAFRSKSKRCLKTIDAGPGPTFSAGDARVVSAGEAGFGPNQKCCVAVDWNTRKFEPVFRLGSEEEVQVVIGDSTSSRRLLIGTMS